MKAATEPPLVCLCAYSVPGRMDVLDESLILDGKNLLLQPRQVDAIQTLFRSSLTCAFVALYSYMQKYANVQICVPETPQPGGEIGGINWRF